MNGLKVTSILHENIQPQGQIENYDTQRHQMIQIKEVYKNTRIIMCITLIDAT